MKKLKNLINFKSLKSLSISYFRIEDQRGVMAIIVALLFIVLAGIAALTIDVGYLLTTRNELQNIADATALAGARKLGRDYESLPYAEQRNYVCDRSAILATVRDVASKNRAAGASIIIADEDVAVGIWDHGARKLTETLTQPDAVKVIVRREGKNSVTTFFAKVLGIDTVPVVARATAALLPQSVAPEGSLSLPIGISERFFDTPDYAGKVIRLYPPFENSNDDYYNWFVGWHTYGQEASGENLKQILEDIKSGDFTSPELKAGGIDICNFVNMWDFYGRYQFSEMKDLFDNMRVKNDNKWDCDSDPNTWTIGTVIYDDDDPDKNHPEGEKKIVGFGSISVIEIVNHGGSEYEVAARINANMIKEQSERRETAHYGAKSSLPGLVE